MSDFILYFFAELSRPYFYEGHMFSFLDVIYAIIVFSLIGMFINHLIQGFFGNKVTQFNL